MHYRECMAERQGFEPWVPFGTTVFETAPFDHSGTSPFNAISFQQSALSNDRAGLPRLYLLYVLIISSMQFKELP